jgi:opacity protein-like surface antigen
MKRLLIAACVLGTVSTAGFASQYKPDQDSDRPVRLFVEYGADLYSYGETKIKRKSDNAVVSKSESHNANEYGNLSIGIEFANAFQVSVSPEYSKEDGTKTTGISAEAKWLLRIDKLAPYISLAGVLGVSYSDDLPIKTYSSGFGIGAGVQYWFNGNVFISGGIEYQALKAEFIDRETNRDLGIVAESRGFALKSSLGARF